MNEPLATLALGLILFLYGEREWFDNAHPHHRWDKIIAVVLFIGAAVLIILGIYGSIGALNAPNVEI